MTTLDASLYGNIVDIAQREDPDGKIAHIVEQLAQKNAFLEDAPFRATNDKDSHKTTRRTGLITPSRRRLNTGVAPTKSSTAQVVDTCTSIEAMSHVDEKLKRREGENFNAFRYSEDVAFMEAFNQQIQYDMIYASTASDPEGMSGLAQRYSSPSTGPYASNVIDAGGSGSTNTSIWLVAWGEQTVHGLYPKNSKAGLDMEDMGRQRVTDSSNNPYWAYETKFTWDYGLAVRDPRAVARIGSIDVTVLAADLTPTEGTTLYDYMVDAMTAVDQAGMGATRKCWYMNQTAYKFFRKQAFHRSNASLTLMQSKDGGDEGVPAFDNIPIKRVDQITNTEAAI